MRVSPLRLLTAFCCAGLAFSAVSGCGQPSLTLQLQGEWVGRPDSVAARELRNPSKVAPIEVVSTEASTDDARPGGATVEDASATSIDSSPTDIEAFDFQITLELSPRGALRMRIGDEAYHQGSWQVVAQIGDVTILELTDKSPETQSRVDEDFEQRRFELIMDPDGDGFILREEGADRRFGWLYFRRTGASSSQSPVPNP